MARSPEADVVPIDPDLAPAVPARPQTGRHQLVRRHRRRPHQRPDVLAAIAVGGALGTCARYGLGRALPVHPGDLPVVTLAINLSGAFVLGFLLVVLIERFPPSRFARPFLAIGFLGSYTTYSAFAVDTVLLVKDGHTPVAAGYVAATMLGGFAVAWLGIVAGRLVPHRHHDRHGRQDTT